MYVESRIKKQLYLHNLACHLLMLCRESLRLEKTIKSKQHPISFLHSPPGCWQRAAGCWWQHCLLPCLSTCIKNGANSLPPLVLFLKQNMQTETKGEISACGGSVERGEFVHTSLVRAVLWHRYCSAVLWCRNNQWRDIPSTPPPASHIKTW